jgi:hypothetical protein
MARFAVTQIDPLELDRPAYESLSDLIDRYREDHPELDSIDDVIEALVWGYGETEESPDE